MRNHYVYGLIDPITGKLRYIGCTQNIKRRYKVHIDNKIKGNPHKKNWINKLVKNNKVPKLIIMDTINTKKEMFEREIWWIRYFKKEKM